MICHIKVGRFLLFYYFCNMNQKKCALILSGLMVGIVIFLLLRMPIISGGWTKQTIYLWLLNSCHLQKSDVQPMIMFIDDDSGTGIFVIHRICEEIGIKATFAVIPSRLDSILSDSLKNWQQEGYGIALHGLKHEHWNEWSADAVINDINRSEQLLVTMGFKPDFQYVVSPYGCNTANVRKAIKTKGFQMVTLANIVNPDNSLFQLGRIMISKNSDVKEMEELLVKAKTERGFVILGTHSSMPDEFSEDKTKIVLKQALNLGLKFV